MAEKDELVQKRQQIKAEIQRGKYKSLAEVMINGTGYVIQKITFSKKPSIFWYNSLVFALLTLLICVLIAIGFGSTTPGLSVKAILIINISGYLGVVLGSLFAIAGASMHRRLLTILKDYILNAIESPDDLNDLRNWLASTFNMKAEFLTSLTPTLLLFPFGIYLRAMISGEVVGLGVYLVAIIAGFQAFTALSVFLASFTLPYRLSRYQLKLFAADPSSSEVIDCLSDTINNIVFLGAILLTLVTLVAYFSNPLVVAVYILLLPWVAIITIFASSHYALAKIINKAKWRILANIQAQIETLQEREEILSEETLSHINKLMDYHNRIKATRNSAIDILAGFSLLQSLLLPVIGLLMANLLNVLEVLAKFTAGK
jgi:hypothetical protein